MIGSLLSPPLCWSCRGPARSGEQLCGGCRRTIGFLPPEPVTLSGVRVHAPVAYEGPARALVAALKFHGALRVAEAMAAIAVACAPGGLPSGSLVPVPLHPFRRRKRGFNQAVVLGEAIARRADLPLADCLRRRGRGPPQVGRGRLARLGGPAGTFEVCAPPPRAALLVDDVVTTGATLAAGAAALRRAGTIEVSAVVFARTPGR
jgi:predicted amidophosphoribosyltransferase